MRSDRYRLVLMRCNCGEGRSDFGLGRLELRQWRAGSECERLRVSPLDVRARLHNVNGVRGRRTTHLLDVVDGGGRCGLKVTGSGVALYEVQVRESVDHPAVRTPRPGPVAESGQ